MLKLKSEGQLQQPQFKSQHLHTMVSEISQHFLIFKMGMNVELCVNIGFVMVTTMILLLMLVLVSISSPQTLEFSFKTCLFHAALQGKWNSH